MLGPSTLQSRVWDARATESASVLAHRRAQSCVGKADSAEADRENHSNGELQQRDDVKGDDSHPGGQKRV